MKNVTKNSLAIPIAIVVAGALIGAAVVFSGNTGSRDQAAAAPQAAQQGAPQATSLDALTPITAKDHIRGNPNAKVKIVEYSDFECPFCKRFHGTMEQVMAEYGASGDVAWVLRQFPLDSLHPIKARQEALASECAAEVGGNEVFWSFADRLFELSLTNNRTDVEKVIPQIVSELGLNATAFAACMESEEVASRIAASVANAAETGGRGTPWSIVVAADGTKYPVNGAQPFEAVKRIIDLALKQ